VVKLCKSIAVVRLTEVWADFSYARRKVLYVCTELREPCLSRIRKSSHDLSLKQAMAVLHPALGNKVCDRMVGIATALIRCSPRQLRVAAVFVVIVCVAEQLPFQITLIPQ
jgi:hypothetical protein